MTPFKAGRDAASIRRWMLLRLHGLLGIFAGPEPAKRSRRRGAILGAHKTFHVTRPAGHVPHPDRDRVCVAWN